MTHATRRLDLALRAARAGGEVALSAFRTDMGAETKAEKTDLVTQADRDAQREIARTIGEEYDEPILGEEQVDSSDDEEPGVVPETGPGWIVDPIDGTNNYVRGLRTWATSVAATMDGEPVAAATVLPALSDTYVAGSEAVCRNGERVAVSDRTDPETFAVVPTIWWDFEHRAEYAAACRAVVERFGDLRRFGCAQAVLAGVADGALDGALTNVETNPWDTVAGVHMVRRAGYDRYEPVVEVANQLNLSSDLLDSGSGG